MASTRIRADLPLPPGKHLKELKRWLAAKRGGIGGSSASVALGMGRWGSRLRLWGELTGKLPSDDGDLRQESERMRWGNLLERTVLQETVRRCGAQLVKNKAIESAVQESGHGGCELVDVFNFKSDGSGGQPLFRSVARPWMHYSLDGMAMHKEDGPYLLEAKTTHSFASEEWEDDVPEHVYIQVQHGFAVTGLTKAWVGALIGGNDLRIFEVERDDELVPLLTQQEEAFMRHVRELVPPPVESPMHPDTLEVLKVLYPEDSGATIELPAEAFAIDGRREHLKSVRKQIQAELDELDAWLRAWLKDATFGVIPGSDPLIQYALKTVKRDGYTVKPAQYRQLTRKVAK